jgi:glycine reductase
VLAKEIEKAGIPTVQICSMLQVARSVGSPRIVAGRSVLHPLGDPEAGLEKERELRLALVRAALDSVTQSSSIETRLPTS